MFEDLFEQEHVFGLLEEWIELPRGTDLSYEIGEKSELMRRLNALIEAITESEKKTIAAKPQSKMVIGFSNESQILCCIWEMLSSTKTPAKLKSILPDLKHNLLRAMVIGVTLKHEGLQLAYREILPHAKYGQARKSQAQNNATAATKARTKYTDEIKAGWVRRARQLNTQNAKLSFRDMARKIADESGNSTIFESVRKHLNKEFG
jgi:hypothetical protein